MKIFSIKKNILHELKQNFSSTVSYNKANLFKQIKYLRAHFVITVSLLEKFRNVPGNFWATNVQKLRKNINLKTFHKT